MVIPVLNCPVIQQVSLFKARSCRDSHHYYMSKGYTSTAPASGVSLSLVKQLGASNVQPAVTDSLKCVLVSTCTGVEHPRQLPALSLVTRLLSAQVATTMRADLLILLSDVDGIYSGHPSDPGSRLIRTYYPEHGMAI